MNEKYTDLYDQFNDGLLDRREFIKRLAVLAGGVVGANTILPMLESNYALAAIVSPSDPSLTAEYITYPGTTGPVRAYMVRDKKKMKKPGVIVIHENRGLNPHIEDVARRMALEGFLAIAPDALSPLGGTPSDQDEARKMIRKLDGESTMGNFLAAQTFLKSHSAATGMTGCVGFCWGGAMANQMAVHARDMAAAVPYYGRQPQAEDVPKIKASLLLHYAGDDKRVNAGVAAYEAALKKAGTDYQIHFYQGAKHAFNNDTNVSRYHKKAAQLAWKRTIAFLKERLRL